MRAIKHSVIYRITNLVDGKIYIGSAIDFDQRKRDHLCRLRKNSHHNKHLQNAWNLYGEQNFTITIEEEVPLHNQETRLNFKKRILEREQHYLNALLFADKNDMRFFEQGYNKDRNSSSPLGRKLSPESIKRISEAHKGIRATEESKLKKSILMTGKNNPFFGRKHSEKTKTKMSDANRGKVMSDESRKKISRAQFKPILQFSKDKKFVKRWSSIKEAAETMNIHAQGISYGLKDERRIAYGFYWKYE